MKFEQIEDKAKSYCDGFMNQIKASYYCNRKEYGRKGYYLVVVRDFQEESCTWQIAQYADFMDLIMKTLDKVAPTIDGTILAIVDMSIDNFDESFMETKYINGIINQIQMIRYEEGK